MSKGSKLVTNMIISKNFLVGKLFVVVWVHIVKSVENRYMYLKGIKNHDML